VPVTFTRLPPLAATHLIVSDCRWLGTARAPTSDIIWIRPRMASTGTLWGPRRGLLWAVGQGEAAVTDDVIARIRMWSSSAVLDKVDTRSALDGDKQSGALPLVSSIDDRSPEIR
jgi:hypothetical protein